ncbi:MAG TPA: L,D-transpeptidase [Acidisoma sp.]|uniref:L,D-transpeptidase n=1 Tax=Acidisoma sp. TaxID=1872115 RepID=UPI002D0771BC|nr:L,D-transpeptidase [Acidisoma sp.]HTI02354.1 L,D-transpeptidase [Acidisoma sp.]
MSMVPRVPSLRLSLALRLIGAGLGLAPLAACAGAADTVNVGSVQDLQDTLFGPRNVSAMPNIPPPPAPAAPTPGAAPIAPALVGTGGQAMLGSSLHAAGYAPPVQEAPGALPPGAVSTQAALIAGALATEVPHALALSPERQQGLVALARKMAAEDHLVIRRPQLLLIVDRATHGQTLSLTLAQPEGPWEILGTRPVSTGKPGRREHFKTPLGVLLNDGSELGYRAQGTYNENHIRGLGVKGMRVWDFGWQRSEDWRTPGATMLVRVEMHATDPAVLAQRLGRADSEGCIRIPEALNRFLDRHGIIDADIERLAVADAGYRALLSRQLIPTPLAGDAVIVVDTSAPWATPYPPVTVALSG